MADETKATYTTHLQLEKPGRKQKYNIGVHNANSDKIDTAIKKGQDALNEHKNASPLDHPANSVKNKHLDDNSVTTTKVADKNITLIKLAEEVINAYYTKGDVNGLISALKVVPKLKSETLAQLGVKYKLNENGYICFGELFGDFKLQWGQGDFNYSKTIDINYPISFIDKPLIVLPIDAVGEDIKDSNESANIMPIWSQTNNVKTRFVCHINSAYFFNWIAFGK